MIRIPYFLIALFISLSLAAQVSDPYKVVIDLQSSENDQIQVTVYPPSNNSDSIEYHMAKIVPGTYEISDFGRFVSEMKAFDKEGNMLDIKKISTNRWKMPQGGKLEKITYKVDDSRDPFGSYDQNSEHVIFEPGGTDISKDKLFVLNTFGVIGYVDGMKSNPYEVTISHNETLFGSSALKKTMNSLTEDTFMAQDFNFLADGPIMYCEPDTVVKKISNSEILVSVYSPNKALSAQEVMDNLTDLMIAQTDYLGGKLPVDRYAYLIILFDDNTQTGAYGALEHSYSSLYYLPENAAAQISKIVRDIAAHEFFHIVTPLNIHAEQIGNFDYINPEMSEHLWLYEGVTEYSSMHVQAKYGLYSPETFLAEIGEKLTGADEFGPDISFTEMSSRILEPDYEPLYRNVYEKGALIGMCLDLSILKYSNGEKDLRWLMQELSKKYGKDLSFKDEELFDVITNLTYPEIGDFLKTHVAGSEPLPIKEALSWVGISYSEPQNIKVITLGKIALNVNEKGQIYVADISQMNSFGKDLKLQKDDVIGNINGNELNLQNAGEVIENFKNSTKEGDKVYFTVERMKKDKVKTKKLKAKAVSVDAKTDYEVSFDENPTEAQKALLKAWISVEN